MRNQIHIVYTAEAAAVPLKNDFLQISLNWEKIHGKIEFPSFANVIFRKRTFKFFLWQWHRN